MTLGPEVLSQVLIYTVRAQFFFEFSQLISLCVGYDSYPNGFDCSNPYTWKTDAVPEWFWGAHLDINPQVLNAVYEFQGGAFDGWYVSKFVLPC